MKVVRIFFLSLSLLTTMLFSVLGAAHRHEGVTPLSLCHLRIVLKVMKMHPSILLCNTLLEYTVSLFSYSSSM